jgi:hypothetical protein
MSRISKRLHSSCFLNLEPTSKALNRMTNSNSGTQSDDPSERANQMIMVSNLI